MKIIILGAGQVGGTLAENLVGENNEITLVDTDIERLRELQDKYDLRVVTGPGSHPRVLREAGAEDADMLVAVTNSDETNMVACQVAYTLFHTPTILPLAESGWSSVHSVISEGDFWNIIEQLKANGAQGILIIPIEKMIL